MVLYNYDSPIYQRNKELAKQHLGMALDKVRGFLSDKMESEGRMVLLRKEEVWNKEPKVHIASNIEDLLPETTNSLIKYKEKDRILTIVEFDGKVKSKSTFHFIGKRAEKNVLKETSVYAMWRLLAMTPKDRYELLGEFVQKEIKWRN